MCCNWLVSRWRMWIRPFVFVSYGLIILIVLPFCIIKFQQNGYSPQVSAWFTSSLFVLMALPITFWEITQHLIHYNKPYLQRYIIRILWMVPIYALNAWMALTFPASSIYLDTCRECYEAYVIYNFMVFLLNFLHFEVADSRRDGGAPVPYLFPFCCFPPCPAGSYFIQACKHSILQYTVIRPITTLISLIAEVCDVYKEGEFSFKYAYPYIVVINNISQFVAMYALVLFYQSYKNELAPMKPIAKFLCIKAVVFFSFFQSVVIAILTFGGVVQGSFVAPDDAEATEVARNLQNFLICVEMFLASVAHWFAFSHAPYVDLASRPPLPCCAAFLAMWDVSDVTRDVSNHIQHVGQKMHQSLGGSVEERRPLVSELRRPVSYTQQDNEEPEILSVQT